MTDISDTVKRGPGRPPLHPKVEPDARSLHERLRGKTRRHGITGDKFFVPPDLIPEGVSMEFKRYSCSGQEDPYYVSSMRQQGWEPVNAEDMPTWAPEGHHGPIIKDGLMLMARPKELTDQARREVYEASTKALKNRQDQMGIAPKGHAPRESSQVTAELMRPVPIEE